MTTNTHAEFSAVDADFWQERSAILEFDAGLSRDAAETAAFEQMLAWRQWWEAA